MQNGVNWCKLGLIGGKLMQIDVNMGKLGKIDAIWG